jgi:hypothetical protein
MAETTDTQTLAPVGKTVYTECKKCATERYHVVLAHKTATSAKVKCEVCGAQKSFSLPKAQSRSKTGTGRGRKAVSEATMRDNHSKEYEKLMQEHDSNPTQTYNMRMKFEVFHKVNHPKFGLGLVRAVQPDKIEVVFPDEVRNLVHNRQQ